MKIFITCMLLLVISCVKTKFSSEQRGIRGGPAAASAISSDKLPSTPVGTGPSVDPGDDGILSNSGGQESLGWKDIPIAENDSDGASLLTAKCSR